MSSHGHSHGVDITEVPPQFRRRLAACAIALGLLTIVGMALLWPRQEVSNRLREFGLGTPTYDARILEVDPERPCETLDELVDDFSGSPEGEAETICPAAVVRLLAGPEKGEQIEIDLPTSGNEGFGRGDRLVLNRDDGGDEVVYSFADRNRKPMLIGLALLFATAVVILGRWRGAAALAGLIASMGVLLVFVLPAILDGRSPVLVAVVGASAIAFLALYMSHGTGPMTTVALLGTLASLGVTLLLAVVFTKLARFSGFVSDEAAIVTLADGRIDLVGLTLGGIVIGALGAIDDITVTQASAVWELRAANPEMSSRDTYRSALRIGRDHIASTVNTLALAYAGASMPLMLLFVLSQQSLGSVANGELVATELVRTLVGSIGLVAAVPVTTALACLVASRSAGGPTAASASD